MFLCIGWRKACAHHIVLVISRPQLVRASFREKKNFPRKEALLQSLQSPTGELGKQG